MKTVHHYLVQCEEVDVQISWIGGALKKSKRKGRVWLTTPGGIAVLEVPMASVKEVLEDSNGVSQRN